MLLSTRIKGLDLIRSGGESLQNFVFVEVDEIPRPCCVLLGDVGIASL